MGLGIAGLVARLTLDDEIGPVQLDEQLRRRAGAAMETVDVLRHDSEELARLLERDHRLVHGVRPCVLIDLPAFQFEVPVFGSRGLGGEELVVVHGSAPRPHATGPSEVGNAAGGRHTRTGNDQYFRGSLQPFDEPAIHHGSNAGLAPCP